MVQPKQERNTVIDGGERGQSSTSSDLCDRYTGVHCDTTPATLLLCVRFSEKNLGRKSFDWHFIYSHLSLNYRSVFT